MDRNQTSTKFVHCRRTLIYYWISYLLDHRVISLIYMRAIPSVARTAKNGHDHVCLVRFNFYQQKI